MVSEIIHAAGACAIAAVAVAAAAVAASAVGVATAVAAIQTAKTVGAPVAAIVLAVGAAWTVAALHFAERAPWARAIRLVAPALLMLLAVGGTDGVRLVSAVSVAAFLAVVAEAAMLLLVVKD